MASFLYRFWTTQRSPRRWQIQPYISSNMPFRYCRWRNTDQSELDSLRARERLRATGLERLQRWWL